MIDLGPLQDFTVFMTVGPTNCGKTHFAQLLTEQLTAHQADVVTISSDTIRRQLIGECLDKYHPRMLEVSQQAFELLYQTLRLYTSYPVNRKFIIIDSTGLNAQFRRDIAHICKVANYKLSCVFFNYKDRKDYFSRGGNKHIIDKHVKVLREHTCKEIKVSDYHKVYRVNEPIQELTLSYPPNADNLVLQNNNYVIVGDVHGCVEELAELKVQCPEQNLILVGDWIDSKLEDAEAALSANKAIIDYLLTNPDILLIKGNHELNLAKKIERQEFKSNPYFSTRELVRDNADYQAKFLELFNRSLINISGPGFVVTHAPCKNKYLFKNVDKQSNFYLPESNLTETLESYYLDYNKCYPRHYFGHIACDKPIYLNNSIGLDTGCSYGHSLTGYNLVSKKFITVQSKQPDQKDKLLQFVKESKPRSLTEEQQRQLDAFVRHQTPYISGTMCPADKTETELESLSEAVSYYAKAGVTELCIQPKYMGSRAQLLLRKDGEFKVYSRNGFLIKGRQEELQEAVQAIQIELTHSGFTSWLDSTYPNWTAILLDCELMPWSFLGAGLIKKEFESYYEANFTHIGAMTAYGFYEDLAKLKKSEEFKSDTSSKYTNVKAWKQLIALDQLWAYKTELDKYSTTEPAHFKVFNLLKVESETEVLYVDGDLDCKAIYNLLPTPLHLVYSLEEAQAVQLLYKHLEGIVIKPPRYVKNFAPYIKVRNPEYLRLIYGHDYDLELDKWIERKSIKTKLCLSKQEWMLGQKLLRMHSNDLNGDNKEYLNTLIELMFTFQQEQGLDPRL